MDRQRVESILSEAERAADPSAVGFWRAVADVKRHPAWIEAYAERIGAIDRRAFELTVSPTFSPAVGTALLTAGTLVGLGLVAAAYRLSSPWNGLVVLGGTGALLGSTHGLAHIIAGRVAGIGFTHWFLDGPTRLQPGAKVDYASYLRASPRSRAWMHASGALVTKAVPFLLLGAARAAGVPGWATGVLLVIGVGQIATDLVYSVKLSDWKRFRREMRVARELESPPSGNG